MRSVGWNNGKKREKLVECQEWIIKMLTKWCNSTISEADKLAGQRKGQIYWMELMGFTYGRILKSERLGWDHPHCFLMHKFQSKRHEIHCSTSLIKKSQSKIHKSDWKSHD